MNKTHQKWTKFIKKEQNSPQMNKTHQKLNKTHQRWTILTKYQSWQNAGRRTPKTPKRRTPVQIFEFFLEIMENGRKWWKLVEMVEIDGKWWKFMKIDENWKKYWKMVKIVRNCWKMMKKVKNDGNYWKMVAISGKW